MNTKDLREEGFSEEKVELIKKFILGGLVQPLPNAYESSEIGRATIMFFYINAYKIMFPEKPISSILNVEETIKYIINSLKVNNEDRKSFNGFTGCELFGEYKQGHISYSYAALATLVQLGYDIRQLNKNQEITKTMSNLMKGESGAVYATSLEEECEHDVRFIFSLCACCYMLNDWGELDKEKIFEFIMKCRSYDYAFGQMPNRESHGGSTYCAIQSISMLGMLDRLDHKEELVHWLIQRSYLGFSGRINKPSDTCYNYWIGCSLKTLGYEHMIDKKFVLVFTESCVNTKYGGISKCQGGGPDPVHTCLSLTGLTCIGALKIPFEIDPQIGIEKPFYLK